MSNLHPVMAQALAPFSPALSSGYVLPKETEIEPKSTRMRWFIARVTTAGVVRELHVLAYTSADAIVIAVESVVDGDDGVPEKMSVSVKAAKGN